MDVKEYKCPNCGGAVQFDSREQKMKCPFCGTEFEIAAIETYQNEAPAEDRFGWDKNPCKDWEAGELESLSMNNCPSCGMEVVGDENTSATVCPYCGNTNIVRARTSGMLKPDHIIPFKLDKNAAKKALSAFYGKKRLLPDLFKQENRINSITGIYVPFWLFDSGAHGRMLFKATKSRSWSTSDFNHTEISFYSCVREGDMRFDRVPVDGSTKMDDAYMDAVEPYDYTQLVPFNSAYLSGFLAEKYDVDADASKTRANERIKASVEQTFAATVSGYNSVKAESSSVQLEGGTISYVLFPLWILNTKYHGKMHTFAMNGQTGRLVGSLPVDKGKYFRSLFGIAGVIGIIATAVLFFIRNFA
jgi:DNA-directed RNA polymerase subunit RPC12/RpoP